MATKKAATKAQSTNKPVIKMTPARRKLINDVYDMRVADMNRNSKFYNQDCDDLWKYLQTRTDVELKETLSRWNAINNISEKEMRRHCQFDGIGF